MLILQVHILTSSHIRKQELWGKNQKLHHKLTVDFWEDSTFSVCNCWTCLLRVFFGRGLASWVGRASYSQSVQRSLVRTLTRVAKFLPDNRFLTVICPLLLVQEKMQSVACREIILVEVGCWEMPVRWTNGWDISQKSFETVVKPPPPKKKTNKQNHYCNKKNSQVKT